MKIEEKSVVSFHYKLTGDDGEVIDSSEGKEPLTYLHGVGAIIPGLEEAMGGRESGEEFEISIEPENAYGDKEPALVQKVPHDAFQGVDEVEEGMQFQVSDQSGNERVVTVVEVENQEVTIDGNHPLAGETLHFEIAVEEVREASDEELEHGHAH